MVTTHSSATDHADATVVTQIVTMRVKPEHEQEFLDLAARIAAQVHASEPGTLLYVLTRHPTEPQTYLWIERYRDQHALEAHGAAPYMAEAMAKVQDPAWWSGPPEVLSLTQVVPA